VRRNVAAHQAPIRSAGLTAQPGAATVRAMRVAALVLAAGRGVRAGGEVPKQYQLLAGEPVLRHALRRLAAHPRISRVQAVIGEDDASRHAAASAGLGLPPALTGGPTRQASARAGLEALAAAPPDAVLIHDAARPLVPAAVVDRVLAALDRAEAAIPALPVADTLKRGSRGLVAATVDRTDLFRVQTPQGFRFAAILAAHRAATHEATDDAALIEAAGGTVALVEGHPMLEKVTAPGDLERLAAAWLAMEPRTGTGFDVHRLAAGRRLVLCGVEIPHAQGLAGHSDADVGIHALCDAIYGALAEGDIGAHFPPTEPRWRDCDSAVFLRHAAGRIAARGGRLVNADVTLICEAPRIRPHAEAMRARLAALLAVDVARVGVKATTTERLGFAGRGEGIAAQAAVSLMLPSGA
jgi:2-C-methyl-D-erythritol 4-phosphate cytidylyltransferase/2-C-methyl-D-erythritol 2,4-cyclodiphosphate synthase